MYKEVQVTIDLSLVIYDDTLEFWSAEASGDVAVADHELPALLAALETAAEALGVETEAARLKAENARLRESYHRILGVEDEGTEATAKPPDLH